MFSKQRLLLSLLTFGAVLALSACEVSVQRLTPSPTNDTDNMNRPIPTLFRFPEKDILSPPAFTTEESFECWTTPGFRTPTQQDRSGQLLIAYRIERSSTWNLYRFDLNTKKHSLLASQIESYGPSPDGLNVWYSFYQTSKTHLGDVVFAHDFANDTRRQVPFPISIDSRRRDVIWSPDSQCLLAWRDNTAFAYRLKDGALQSRTFPGADFGFNSSEVSSDGRWWAWSCGKDICIMSPEGQRIEHDGLKLPILAHSQSGYYNPGTPRWSPDGRMLAISYPGRRSDFDDSLRIIHLDEQSIVSFQDIDLKEPIPIRDVRWSPDGLHLAIQTMDGVNIYDTLTHQVLVLRSPDEDFFTSGFAWSPDGKQIVMVVQEKEYKSRDRLYLTNADGTNTSQLPTLPQEAEGAEMVAPYYHVTDVYWVP